MIDKKIVTAISLTSLGIVLSGTSVFANTKTGKVIASTLNIRSGPSTDNSIIGYVHKGEKVEIVGSSNGWYKVKLSNGKIGWGSENYINIDDETNIENTDIQENISDNNTGIVTADALNVRSGPSTSYGKVLIVHKGQNVDILETSNGWYKIKLQDGQIGWASSSYIKTSYEASDKVQTSEKDNEENEKGTITANVLNVRSGTSTKNPILDKVYKGQHVDILDMSNCWYKVKTKNGRVGWASGEYISTYNSSIESKEEDSNLSNNTVNSAQSIVDLAKAQLGKPYVWGAEGPNCFDCSGLVYYVYGQKGINMPRTSREQANVGTTISQSQLQPGDLLFASTDGSGNVNHVGIYIGNGQMIHAPKPGDVVKTTNINISYWQNTYVVAKRIL